MFYFLGRPPLPARSLQAALQLLWISARGGSADAQYLLGVLHQNLYLLPKEPPLIGDLKPYGLSPPPMCSRSKHPSLQTLTQKPVPHTSPH